MIDDPEATGPAEAIEPAPVEPDARGRRSRPPPCPTTRRPPRPIRRRRARSRGRRRAGHRPRRADRPEAERRGRRCDRRRRRAADAETEEPHEIPEVPSGPRTVGRFIADALRAAGVRVAFTVPGESFLGVLDALEDAGIRVVATRHEGGAAFMAEAYGQLTGRPAACLGTRAVGSANLAIGDPHRPPGLDADVRPGRPGRARRSWAARRSRRSTRSPRSVGSPSGRPSRCRPRRSRRSWPRPCARPSAAGPDRSCWRCRRTCSTSSRPTWTARRRLAPATARATEDEIRSVLASPGRRRAPGHPRRRRRPAGPDVDRAAQVRRAAARPGHRRRGAAPTSSRTTTRSTSGWPASGRRRSSASGWTQADAILVLGSAA